MFRHLFRDSVVYGAVNAVQKLVPFFVMPLVISYLGQKALKVYDVSFSYAYVVMWLVVLGLDAAASLLFFDEKKTTFDKRKVVSYALCLQLCSLLVFFSLVFPFSGFWGRLLFSNDAAVASGWRTALLILPGQILFNFSLNILLWQKQKAAYALLCFVQTLASIGSVYAALVIFNGRLPALFTALICSMTFTGLVGLLLVRKQVAAPLLPVEKALLKKLLWIGFPFALTAFFQQLLPAVDRFFLLRYNFGNAMAPYVLAAKLGSLINFGTSAFVLAFTPYSLSKLNDENAEAEISRLFRVVSFCGFLAVPLLLVFKDFYVLVFANESYRSATGLLPFFFFGWIFDLFFYFSTLGVYRSQKTVFLLLLFFVGVAIVCLLNFLLVPWLGLYGAAASFCLGKMLLFFGSQFLLKRYFHLQIHACIFSLTFLASVACTVFLYLLPVWIVGLMLFLVLLAGAAFYRKKILYALISSFGPVKFR